MKVLLSAYACEPNRGSEPGVGWNWIEPLSRQHEVWVITRANNRSVIEAVLPPQSAHFVYCDLPGWLRWWKKGAAGILLYSYLWQFQAYLVARKLHARVGFDVVHHITFAKYWMPSLLSLLPVRFIWGPVGGGDSTPPAFLPGMSLRGRTYERLRHIARNLSRFDPLVLLTARRAAIGLATTEETAVQVRSIGCRNTQVFPAVGLTLEEIETLGALPPPQDAPFRFVSIGNLLHLKAFELGLRAFGRYIDAGGKGEYWIIGDGPERSRLETVTADLGLELRVRFWGEISRAEVLRKLAHCAVLVHPSLHDSGGFVCLEAMAAGRPVVCLDLGGPGLLVTSETGFKVAPGSPGQVIADMAAAFGVLSNDRELLARMSVAGRRRVRECFSWERKSQAATHLYEIALAGTPA